MNSSSAFVSESIFNSNLEKFRGELIGTNIYRFYENCDDGPILAKFGNKEKTIIQVENTPSLSILFIIKIPEVLNGQGLICSSSSNDSIILALSRFNKFNQNQVPVIEQNHQDIRLNDEWVVPSFLVEFCRVTSLSSTIPTATKESSNIKKEVLWKHVSMIVAISKTSVQSKKLDFFLGIILFFILLQYWNFLSNWSYEFVGYEVQSETLKEKVEFVTSKHAPFGFKLNPQADFLLANTVILIIDAWHYITSFPARYSKELYLIICGIVTWINKGHFGLSIMLAIAFDTVAILVLHVGVLHRIISRIWKFQLQLLGSLWLLIRGKKKNQLRSRVDTLKTDSAQLILGTMSIFFFSFTLQTTMAYHLLVLLIWLLVSLFQSLLFFLCVLTRTIPIDQFLLALRDKKSDNFHAKYSPKSFYFVQDGDYWRLYIIPHSIIDVLKSWFGVMNNLWNTAWDRRWGRDRNIILNILYGSELPAIPIPSF